MNKYVRVFIIAILIGLLFGLYFYFFQGSPRRQIVSSVLFSVNIGCLMMVFIYQRKFFLQRITRPLVGILSMMIGLVIVAIIGTELTLYSNSILFTRHYK